MNHCVRLSDRMPDVALGGDAWSSGESAHLADCPDCRTEWRLVRAAHELDESAPTVSDPEAMSTLVQRRLAADRSYRLQARRAWRFAAAAGAAAAILIALGTGLGTGRDEAPRTVARAGTLVPLPELEGLGTAQLDTLLQSLDRPLDDSSTLDASTLGEHEDGELEQVFATWEG